MTNYGEGIDSIYTRDNVYWLTWGRAVSMPATRVKEGGSGAGTFTETLHQEQDRFAATLVSTDPSADYWFWDYAIGGYAPYDVRSFVVSAAGVGGTSDSARLTVNLSGATSTGTENEHHVRVKLNGTVVGEGRWQAVTAKAVTLVFPQTLLREGANDVELEAMLDPGVSFSIFYVDSFDLSYQRVYEAAGAPFFFRGEQNPAVTVSGFSSPDIALFDLSDPLKPKKVRGAKVEQTKDGFALRFAPASPEAQYLALTPSGLKAPYATWADAGSRLAARRNAADYLILTTAELKAAAQELAHYRAGQGMKTMVVELEDILDEFNYGLRSPRAVGDFLRYAYSSWSTPPRYVVLAGRGTFDYKDNQGLGSNLLPPLMVRTGSGLFASDNQLADVVGDDGVPEMAVGRLPVGSAAELASYVEKIQAYEREDGAEWARRVLLLADNPDHDADFPADSERVASNVPPYFNVERVYLSELSVEEAREKLIERLNAGASLVNYMGHGGLDRLADEGLLLTTDLGEIHNGNRLPVFAGMTCSMGRFDIPGFSSLAEELVNLPGGGAAAVWAPTGLSESEEAKLLANAFFRALFHERQKVLGEAVLRSLHDFAAEGGRREMLDIYHLFGDPALRIKEPIPPSARAGAVSRKRGTPEE